jgi:hypothetical protein
VSAQHFAKRRDDLTKNSGKGIDDGGDGIMVSAPVEAVISRGRGHDSLSAVMVPRPPMMPIKKRTVSIGPVAVGVGVIPRWVIRPVIIGPVRCPVVRSIVRSVPPRVGIGGGHSGQKSYGEAEDDHSKCLSHFIVS